MKLEPASRAAIEYACKRFHYAKVVPATSLAFSVFEAGEWCGVICFGGGASAFMGKPYGLTHGQYLELLRVALNGKQSCTSKAVAIAIRLVRKKCPMVRLLISYADKGQGHHGTIYQATNWYFVEETESSGTDVFYKGKWGHDRVPNTLPKEVRSKLPTRKRPGKRKYLYPLNPELRKLCEKLRKPYTKAREAKAVVASCILQEKGGSNPTRALNQSITEATENDG